MKPLVSIIIPVYNQSKSLVLTLDSIEKQSYQNLEVIVVDDGSDEEIENKKLEIKGKEVAWVRQENKGAPVARNKGFELSSGEYVIFWDADLVGEIEMIEKMYQALKDTDVSFAYSDFYFGGKKMKGRNFDGEALRKNNYITTTSLIRRKDFPGFSARGGLAFGWDESLKKFQDWDLWLTMVGQGKKGVWVPECLFKIKSGGTMSSWLPKFVYKKPWSFLPGVRGRVKDYEDKKKVVMKKHGLK